MCGRFTLRADPAAIAAYFDFAGEFVRWRARYNVAPSQNVLAVRRVDDLPQFCELRWGLIPSWSKDRKIAASTTNARAETVDEKPAFRAAFRKRRCLIPADGYYEWRAESRGKIPYLFEPTLEPFFAFAGLWETWIDPSEGCMLETCSILTTSANETVAPLHHRIPVVLARNEWESWLARESTREELKALLKPCAADRLCVREVSTYVNNAAHEGEECVRG